MEWLLFHFHGVAQYSRACNEGRMSPVARLRPPRTCRQPGTRHKLKHGTSARKIQFGDRLQMRECTPTHMLFVKSCHESGLLLSVDRWSPTCRLCRTKNADRLSALRHAVACEFAGSHATLWF